MPNQEFDTLLTKSKTAKRVGVTTRTVDRWSNQPELGFPAPCIVNKRRYFSSRQIDAWLESRKPSGPPMPAPAPTNPIAIVEPPPPRMTKRRIEAMQSHEPCGLQKNP
jgi:predicted DNA-binding transcriptional regulator AlpA